MDDKELVERLRKIVSAFEQDRDEQLSHENERADLWPEEVDVPLAEVRKAASRLTVLREALDEIANARWPSVDGDDPVKRIQARARQALSGEESE